MADVTATAKAARAEDQKVVEKSRAEYNERMKGRPVPSQEECDLIKLGAPVPSKTKSGAGPDLATRGPGGPGRPAPGRPPGT